MKAPSGLLLNSIAQAGVRILGAACGLALSWLIARESADSLGVFRTLFSFLLVGDAIALLGMHTYIIREVSLQPEELKKLALHSFMFSLMVAAAAVVGLCALAFLGDGYSQSIRNGLFFVAASLPATAASLVAVAILVGLGRTTTYSSIQGVETFVRTGIGIALILLGHGVLTVIAVMALLRWLLPLAYWRAIKPHLDAKAWSIDWAYFRHFLSRLPTFAGITVLAMVLRFAAPLLLPWALDDAAAGQFAAAYIFIELVLLVPTALTVNLIPLLARQSQEAGGNPLRAACRQGIKTMALGVIPVVGILSAIALPIFAWAFPGKADYAIAAGVLQVLIWICVLQAIDQVLAATILAKGQQHIDLLTLAIGAIAMLACLATFVPLWGVMGAAYGVLGGYAAVLIARVVLVGRKVGGINMPELLWRPVIAGAAATVIATISTQWHWIIGALVGGLAYIAILAVLGAFNRSEREGILRLLQTGKA